MTNAEGNKTLTFKLVVADGHGGTAEDTVTITVNAVNEAPTANAGTDQQVNEGTASVSLSGSGTDPDGDTPTYTWTQTGGSNVALSATNVASPTFTAPVVTNAEGSKTLTFKLVVADGHGGTAEDTVTITVNAVNEAPTANAGTEQQVNEGTANVSLNGSGTDPDGDTPLYTWTQTGGPNVALSATNVASPTFTAPAVTNAEGSKTLTFKLVVADGHGGTAEDTVTITVNAVNEAPTANAGSDQSALAGATVSLSGTGSTDPDGDTLTYSWTQTGGTPTGITLTGANTATPSFTAPTVSSDATLTFTLTVSDGHGVTATDTVDVLVKDRYTKISSAGTELSDSAAADTWSCVKDENTGLIWEVKTNDGGLHDKDDRYTWYNTNAATNGGSNGYPDQSYNRGCYGYSAADSLTYCNTEAYVNRVNAASWCGAGDWRMPTRTELLSIVDSSRTNPAINTAYFPNTMSTDSYWSGTLDTIGSTTVLNSGSVWDVSFYYGTQILHERLNPFHVRLVRSGP